MNFKIVLAVLFVILIISFCYDNFYTANLISGSYSYDFPLAVPEGPNEGDKLILMNNGDFKSDTWGRGTYKIEGTRITFNTHELGFQTKLYRPFFLGKPRISISSDLGYYFKQN
ncbi:hypothetical protein [Pedobacter jamesrossensis]|uniref:Uncharacterized protein n=1 Tax=Pedobacter jamesrossensis TaxID=1908238 RepID=A0ABV8NI31_9SPHI